MVLCQAGSGESAPAKRSSIVLKHPRLVCSGSEIDLRDSTVWSSPSLEHCALCLEHMVDGESVQPMSNCSHVFHHECVKEWLQALPVDEQKLAQCPLCRGPVATRRSQLCPTEQLAAIRIEVIIAADAHPVKKPARVTCGCVVQ